MTDIQLNKNHLPWLDGLRGIAAVWVLLSHLQILSGMRYLPVLSWGGLAVDLFMMLSGFLMAHHYIERKQNEPWHAKKTIVLFWVRRFFRIAPLFYLLLMMAFLIGPWLGECRLTIASIWPSTATPSARYNDNSLINLFTHMSFVFGILPDWAFRSPLPDWSIGLEMQFYLAFPFIMLSMAHVGPIKTSCLIILLCLGFRYFCSDLYHAFQMPSFLLIKLYVFLLGIWIAYSRSQGSMKQGFMVAIGIAFVWLVIERDQVALARIFLIMLMFYMMDNGTMPFSLQLNHLVLKTRKLLSHRVSVFLGDTSYAVYLLHLLIVLPIAAWLVTFPDYLMLPGGLRFLLCLVISLPLIYAGAWLLFNNVEKNGITLGKQLIKAIDSHTSKIQKNA